MEKPERYKGVSPQNCQACQTEQCPHYGEVSEYICKSYFPYLMPWSKWGSKNSEE